MPALLPRDTRAALPDPEKQCTSRSLLLDRFADPADKERSIQAAIRKSAHSAKIGSWKRLLLAGLRIPPTDLIFATLKARLMVNMSGGVLENAGLCLDRLSGLPTIPGSAVKGCARKTAIRQLAETTEIKAKSAILAGIATVFGWTEVDWSDDVSESNTPVSDFCFACGSVWDEVRTMTRRQLFSARFPDRPLDPKWWDAHLASVAGAVDFFPAFPWSAPAQDLEIDVLTCHHPRYYASRDPRAEAADIEDPVPVMFPTVAPGHVFVFALRSSDASLANQARSWLSVGLAEYGLGSKTSAGYGWFETGGPVQKANEAEASTWLEAEHQREADAAASADLDRQLASHDPEVRHAFRELSVLDPTRFAEAVLAAESWTDGARKRALLLCFSVVPEKGKTLVSWRKSEKPNNAKRVRVLQALASELGLSLP